MFFSLFNTAYAAPAAVNTVATTATTAPTTDTAFGGILSSPLLILAVFAVFIYFLMWRPQSKKAKQQREMLAALKAGDEVVTTGGVYGRISKVDDTFLTLLISANTEIMLQKTSVSVCLPKGTIKNY